MANPTLDQIQRHVEKIKKKMAEADGVPIGQITKKDIINVKLDQTEFVKNKEELQAMRTAVEDQLNVLEELLASFKAFKIDIPQTIIPPFPAHPKEIKVSNLSELLNKDGIVLEDIKELLTNVSDNIKVLQKKELKLPRDATDPLAVRLSNGKEFINQLTQWVQSGGGGGSVPKVRLINGQEAVLVVSGLSLPQYDFVEVDYPTTINETYTFRQGGSGGQLVATVAIEYTDSTKDSISTVTKT